MPPWGLVILGVVGCGARAWWLVAGDVLALVGWLISGVVVALAFVGGATLALLGGSVGIGGATLPAAGAGVVFPYPDDVCPLEEEVV